MIPEKDILDAIAEVEKQPDTFAKAAKLATFYSLLDHLYPEPMGYSGGTMGSYGQSDFLKAVSGKDEAHVLAVMDELMDAVAILMPRLYDGAIRKLEGH